MFGETWQAPKSNTLPGSPRSATAAASASTAAPGAAQENGGASLPYIVGSCLLAVIVLVLIGSGGKTSVTSPKALLFVVSGLKATEFMDAVVTGPFGPNMKAIAQSGSYAACLHADDERCCRTQDGPRIGAFNRFEAAPGIASILTGVNADKHRVNNDSADAMSHFTETSKQFPSVLRLAKLKGFTTAVVGARNMLSTLGDTGRCSFVGVVDFECGADTAARCLGRSTCNVDMRVPLPPAFSIGDTAPVDGAAREYTRVSPLVPSESSRISELANEALGFVAAGTDLIVVHIDALDLASTNAAAGGDYSATSKLTMGALYMVDSVIGQITAIVNSRVAQSRENWLVLGVADHGGFKSTSGATMDEDELVAFFGTTYTLAGALRLQAPLPPVRQYDVAPTVLKWLGIPAPAGLDGTAQMLCSNGVDALNCSSSAAQTLLY